MLTFALFVGSYLFVSSVSADTECAFSAMGMIATPLDSCSVYSMSETTSMSYSSSYTYDEDTTTLSWNYYSDLACSALAKSYEMDSIMMGIHHMTLQTNGAASNCQTVDIKVKGSYSKLTDDCDDDGVQTTDYRSMSYVINECVASSMDKYSAMLMCDAEKIYFQFYHDCLDCNCGDAQVFVYEYYADKDASCYSVQCNAQNDGSLSHVSSPSDAQFLKTLISNSGNTPILAAHIASRKTVQRDEQTSSMWIYVAVASGLLVACCALCRYINSFKKANGYVAV